MGVKHLENDRAVPRGTLIIDLLLFRGIWGNGILAGLFPALGIFAVLHGPLLVVGLILYTIAERIAQG